ncbi:mechanosensitive ion channel family protein [Marinobacter halophilus]|uniref:Mechanosensitive ion channel protein MscS n=1 Tax=Marinobacter halophilus TaxID=1323740 RepID=A0A2T1K9K6_9GAMM|nr:mechanosensitive ion channel family protein [Marinobacter halophilus]PSF06720.1 mechanosensitive ion channel protein MscS [Marinobacter halophilus]GGC74955.1 mechanosensitive ion channel protein MscS [Marinobacter halophilus]
MVLETLGILNSWIKDFGMLSEGWRASILVFVLVFSTATAAFIASRVIGVLERKFSSTNNLWDDALLHAARSPVVAFIWLQGVFWAAEVAYRFSEAEIFTANRTLLQIGFVWVFVWALLRLVKEAEKILVSPMKMRKPMDFTTVSAISKLLRAAVIITAVLTALQTLGFSISGVLAFGGVGGIAVGFAAKDLLANFFGGFIIHLDRPFKVGDWVRSPDRNIEGTVEHIGWRLTTIRTFDKRPLYVPNATFTTIAVENPSRMTNRRISETIGIRYADVRSMKKIVDEIREMLKNHEEIETEQTLIVNFLAFNASSLDIMVYTFTKTTQWVRFHEIKEDVLLKISDIIESYDAEVAFPTRTLHLPDGLKVSGAGREGETSEPGKGSSQESSQTQSTETQMESAHDSNR